MATMMENASLPRALAVADQALRAGDPGAAEQALTPLLRLSGADPRLLHMMGLVKMHSRNFEEAARFFAKAREADPKAAALAFSHGTALRWLERPTEAVEAFRAAAALKPDYAEAYFEA